MLVYPNYAKKYASTIEKSLHHSTFYRQNFQIFIQKPKLELPTCLVLFVNAYTLRKCQLVACNRQCHQTNFVAHFQVLAGRLQLLSNVCEYFEGKCDKSKKRLWFAFAFGKIFIC